MIDYSRLFREAYRLAAKGPDRSTHNAAFLVDSSGCIVREAVNGFVGKGMGDSDADHERPRKYSLIECAERKVICDCARLGISTDGLILVAPWAACSNCAKAIVLAGITLVVRHKTLSRLTPDRWREDVAVGDEIMAAGGTIVHDWVGFADAGVLFNGEEIYV